MSLVLAKSFWARLWRVLSRTTAHPTMMSEHAIAIRASRHVRRRSLRTRGACSKATGIGAQRATVTETPRRGPGRRSLKGDGFGARLSCPLRQARLGEICRRRVLQATEDSGALGSELFSPRSLELDTRRSGAIQSVCVALAPLAGDLSLPRTSVQMFLERPADALLDLFQNFRKRPPTSHTAHPGPSAAQPSDRGVAVRARRWQP